MQAIRYEEFRGPLAVTTLPDPAPPADGVVLRVDASGLCRSDWHGWMGHDPDIQLPHVPGHELAGTVVAVGARVRRFKAGDRVTTPFCMGCGTCRSCVQGQPQICDAYYQPGFTGPGSFAELVALPHADLNLVALPPSLSAAAAALLGCRFATAYRAVVAQGAAQPGDWVAVHGCGGVGLSAVMIAHAIGSRVVAVDVRGEALAKARDVGAATVVDARTATSVPAAIRELTDGGAHVSLDALGSAVTCANSILSLRKQGRHVQVGLMAGEHRLPPLPMGVVIANELEIRGSHGMQGYRYDDMLRLIADGRLDPERLIARRIGLADVAAELPRLGEFGSAGVIVVQM